MGQLILNNLYTTIEEFFSNFSSWELPSWVQSMNPTVIDVLQTLNFFVPLDTFLVVSVTVFEFNILLFGYSFLSKKLK